MWWECSECLFTYGADPTGHNDRGGKITVYGPHCPECGSEHVCLADDQDDHSPQEGDAR